MRCSTLELMSDNELAFLAQSGDQAAARVIFERYERYIRYFSGVTGSSLPDTDDFMQEGSIGLVFAIRCFRPDAGASFKTFACLCIKRQILSAVRVAARSENAFSGSFAGVPAADAPSPEDLVIMRERISKVKDALCCTFTPFERKLFSLYIDGFSYKSIARQMNVCTKKVDNSIQRIKRRLGIIIQ